MRHELKTSLGCELQPILIPALPAFKRQKIVSHLQVTIPNTLTFFQAKEAADEVAVIAHCNLLNTFGQNRWAELKPLVRQIRALNPVHVVEHFTAFRNDAGQKTGVAFDISLISGSNRQAVIDNVKTWQDMLGIPLCLENIPIASDVEAYFDFMLDVKNATGCLIACDLPHFFLSVFSARLDAPKIQALAEALDPAQLHVGGLSLSSDGFIRDNHKIFSPWVVSHGRALFPSAKFITLEQNHQIPPEVVERNLKSIDMNEGGLIPTPDDIAVACGVSTQIANLELARETARASRYTFPSLSPTYHQLNSRRYEGETESYLQMYDKYLPFLSPLSAIQESADSLTAAEMIRQLVAASQWSFSYLSWWDQELAKTASALIRYGQDDKVQFERRIAAPASQFENFEETHRFSSRSGFWVEVTSPKFSMLKRDLNLSEEFSYDERAI